MQSEEQRSISGQDSLTLHSAFLTLHLNMAINYAKLFNRRVTPQSQPIPGSTQVRNSDVGYSWEVDDWTRFDRFLILGADGGTYYIGERELVKQNHDALRRISIGAYDGYFSFVRILSP